MALREMEQFNEIIDKIKHLISWYKYNNYENKYIKSFISSGNSFNYKSIKLLIIVFNIMIYKTYLEINIVFFFVFCYP